MKHIVSIVSRKRLLVIAVLALLGLGAATVSDPHIAQVGQHDGPSVQFRHPFE